MNEYVIHARVKNNLILRRILERYPTVAAFCKATGMRQTDVGKFVNMNRRAQGKREQWSLVALRLAQALDVQVEELFTEEQAQAQLKSNLAFIEMSRQQALEMTDPMRALEDANLVQRMMERAGLDAREVQVLALRFKGDKTLAEVGDAMGVGVERARQIEWKALRKMRHPRVARIAEEAGKLVRGKRDTWLRDDR